MIRSSCWIHHSCTPLAESSTRYGTHNHGAKGGPSWRPQPSLAPSKNASRPAPTVSSRASAASRRWRANHAIACCPASIAPTRANSASAPCPAKTMPRPARAHTAPRCANDAPMSAPKWITITADDARKRAVTARSSAAPSRRKSIRTMSKDSLHIPPLERETCPRRRENAPARTDERAGTRGNTTRALVKGRVTKGAFTHRPCPTERSVTTGEERDRPAAARCFRSLVAAGLLDTNRHTAVP